MTSKSKVLACLSYLGILVLIPLIAAKDDEFVQFHVRQGAKLTIFGIIILSVVRVVYMVFAISGLFFGVMFYQYIEEYIQIVFAVGFVIVAILGIISTSIGIIFLVLCILGIVNAYRGLTTPLPIIGKKSAAKSSVN